MAEYQKFSLANGLQFLIVPMAGVKSVTVLVGVGAGSRNEKASKAGLSHFLEHMASKGTKGRPTPFQVASVIDSIGGEQNAGTSKESTEYWVKVASPYLEIAFDFLADNLKNSIYDQEQIERERRVIIEEINMYEDLPVRRVMDIFEQVLYINTPLGRDISGDKKTVSRIRREDFFQYLESFYQAQNMVVVVAGKISSEKVKKLTAKYFGDLKKGKQKEKPKLRFSQRKVRVKLVYKKTDQSHFCLGVYGLSFNDADRFVVSMIASILGYSRTSRIYRRIREEKGLAYYVHTFPEFFVDTGSLFTQAGVDLKKLEESVILVKREYLRLCREPVSARELKRAKDCLKGRLILALEDSYNVASRYAVQAVLEKEIRTPEETLRLIDKVTSKDVLRVSQRLFAPEKLNLVVIGPERDEARFKKILSG